MIRNILLIVGVVLAFGLGIWLTVSFYQAKELKTKEDSQVLMEKIKNVCKLVTVEGYFSEVYDYKDYWGYDFSFFRKKALIRVKAKVSVGYDLSAVKVTAKPEEKTIYLANLPEPTIISIDHDLDYYDISEGTFNSFTPEDYTKLNEKAKQYIKDLAQKSELMEQAKKQGNSMVDMIKFMVEGAGWKLVMENPKNLPVKN